MQERLNQVAREHPQWPANTPSAPAPQPAAAPAQPLGARPVNPPRARVPLRWISALFVLAVLAAAALTWWFSQAPLVAALSLRAGPLTRTLQFSARVATLSRVDVGSTVTGRVVQVAVRQGAQVRQGELNTSFLVVTHDPRLAARCDRIIELVDGRIERDEIVDAKTTD